MNMSAMDVDPIDFSQFNVYQQSGILKKMTFEGFATFMQTCRLAGALNLRNDKCMYPMENVDISIEYNLDVENLDDNEEQKRIICIDDGSRKVYVSFEQCEKIWFSSVGVLTIEDTVFTKETCDLLQRIETIETLKCNFMEFEDPHMIEFLKNANIKNLKMTTTNQFDIQQFPYDTSHIENVEVDNCRSIAPFALMSIKAQRQITLRSCLVTLPQISDHIQKASNGNVADLEILDWTMYEHEFHAMMNCFQMDINDAGGQTSELRLDGENTPFMEIHLDKKGISFVGWE